MLGGLLAGSLGAPAQTDPGVEDGPEISDPEEPQALEGGVVEQAREATRIDRIVASIGGQVITASDLDIERALVDRSPSPIPPLQAAREDPLQALVDRAVLKILAGGAAVYQPDSSELLERSRALRATFDDPADWEAFQLEHGLDADRLSAVLRGLLVAERYVGRNVGLGLPDGADAEAYGLAYDAWMRERRSRAPVRLIDEQAPR